MDKNTGKGYSANIKYQVYLKVGNDIISGIHSVDGLQVFLWRPRMFKIFPPGMGFFVAFWWICHICHIFKSREYAIFYFMDGKRIAHRSCIVPAYFRWPFMKKDDLQISSTWTDPDYRGKGLATSALCQIVALFDNPQRTFWYVTRINNPSSISVCKKAGFRFYGCASRTQRFGVRVLGQLIIDQNMNSHVDSAG